MKKSLQKFMAVLALLLFMAPAMVAWGQTTHTIGWGTASGDAGTYTNFTATSGNVGDILSFETAKNSSSTAPAYNSNSSELRLYYASNGNGGSITITPVSGLTITNAVITTSTSPSVAYYVDGGSAVSVSASNNTYTISGISASTSLEIKNANTSNTQLRIKTIALTYITDGPQPTTYTVTFNAGDGTFVGNTDFPNANNNKTAGTYTLPSATPASGYTFDGWTATGINTPVTGEYTVSGDVAFTASYTENTTPTPIGDNITFDFEDNGAHRSSGSNNYASENTYTENNTTISLMYADAVTTGSPINGSANIMGRIAKNTTNSPTIHIGSIDITNKTITSIEYKTKGVAAMSQVLEYSLDNSNWTNILTLSSMPTSAATETADNLSITGTNLYLRWTTSVTSSTNSNRDFQLDDVVISYLDNSGSAVATTTTITVPVDFNNDIYTSTNAGTLTATVTENTNNTTVSGAAVAWSSSNTDVATVDANGVVTLVAVGTTTITASYAGVEDQYRPSSATYELTVINSNAPGTQNNPYTVAQARAAIDANTGVTDVYAKGIVSDIPTVWSSQFNNITFNFVDETGDVDFLQAYRCASSSTADASEVQVGDTVLVYGTLTKYNSTYEFGQGCQLISLTRPAVAVEAPTFSPAAGTYADAQTVTISCATNGATIYYTTDGTEPTDASTEYTTAITVSTTTTIKAIAYVGTENSVVATATYHINSQANPYTVTEALAFHEYPANGIYVHGIVSTAPSQDPTSNGELTYYISADGTAGTDNQLEVYKGKGLEQAAFTAQNDIQVGDIVTVYGNVQVYNNTIEFGSGNYLVAFERPTTPYTLTVETSANVEIYTFVGETTDPGVEGATTLQVNNGTEVGLSVSAADGYVLTLVVDGTDVTSQLDETGYYTFTMPTHDVSVTATATLLTTSTYTLTTSIESGKSYIIVGWADGDPYAMGEQKTNNRGAHAITVDGTTATVNSTDGVYEFTFTSLGEGFYSIYDASAPGYLYAASSSSNHLKTEAALDENHNGEWEISINAETGLASVVATNSSNRKVMQFNHGDKLFSCYSSDSQHPVYLYVKVETDECTYAVTETNPFVENFDSSTQMPDCWSTTSDDQYAWMIYEELGYQNSNCVAADASVDLSLPKLTLPATGTTQLSFHSNNMYPEYCTSTEGNSVMISTDNGQTFTTLWTPTSYTDNWELVGPISLAQYAGQTVQILFRVTTNTGAEHHYWILDDIRVEVAASSECAKISAANLPYNEGFENMTTSTEKKTGIMPTCWTLAYEDYAPMADTARPQVFYADGKPASGDYCLFMFGMGILAMPQLADDLDISTLKMSFALRQHKLITQLQVGVMSDLSDETTFTPLATFDNGANTEVQHYVVDFRQYSGNDSPKYIAFRNILAPGHDQQRSVQYIDDISIYVANSADDPDPDHACGIEVPYSQNFDNLTANTTSLTGITPDCWNFIAEADNATAPQVSFGTDNAQSGNYSLYMTGRGYLALPEITNAQSLSGLSVSFFVRQKKYAQRLQVGVMTDPDDESTFVKIADIYNNGNYSTPVPHTVSLAAYSGNGKHIAFRNVATNASAVSYNWIDDISIFETPAISCGITVPYEQGFENGIPDCWTFSPDLEGAAAPQISGEYASSGANSLYMSGMGTFALPEITNVNDLSGLTLTFSVRQRKFAHRIAVGVMTDPSDPNTFVEIERIYNGGVYNMPVEHSVDLSAYSGNGKHIAFRNVVTNSNTVSQQWIDDISIDLTPARSAETEQTSYEYADNDATNEALAPLGVDGFDINDFTVWPNPTTGTLTLGTEAQRVEVNSLTGQKVAVFENTSRIDISNLPVGVYILKATLPQGNAVRKIVKR